MADGALGEVVALVRVRVCRSCCRRTRRPPTGVHSRAAAPRGAGGARGAMQPAAGGSVNSATVTTATVDARPAAELAVLFCARGLDGSSGGPNLAPGVQILDFCIFFGIRLSVFGPGAPRNSRIWSRDGQNRVPHVFLCPGSSGEVRRPRFRPRQPKIGRFPKDPRKPPKSV